LVLFKRQNKMRCVLGGTTAHFVFNELNKLFFFFLISNKLISLKA